MEDGTSDLILPESIAGKWGVGSEIVVTSNSINWFADQRRTITGLFPADDPGYIRLQVNEPLEPSTNTVTDNVNFAVEVALLSRNIRFETSNVDGAHFWIMRTPSVVSEAFDARREM